MNNIFYPKQINRVKIKTCENQCFFAMPFSDTYNNIYDTISLYLEQDKYTCIRVDKNYSASVPIINLILNGIAESQYIIGFPVTKYSISSDEKSDIKASAFIRVSM